MAQNLKSMKVSEVMTRSVVCTCPNTSTHDILKKLNSSNISGMLVVEDNTVIGLVSGSDILQLSIQGKNLKSPGKNMFLPYMAAGGPWWAAKYSYGVWERFPDQENPFLEPFFC